MMTCEAKGVIIYLVGMSCVVKTTICKMLAEKLGYSFFDLDEEIDVYFKSSYKKADYQINIDGLKLEKIPEMIIQKIGSDKLIPTANN